MSTTKTATLVRLWRDGYNTEPRNAFVDDWDGGGFSLHAAHPLARQVWSGLHKHTYILTVFSSDELEWEIHRVTVGTGELRGRSVFYCRPRREVIRQALISDDYLVSMWLAAEQRWLAADFVAEEL